MNKYGKYIKTLVGVSALAFIFGMNARHALTGYGVKDGKLHIEVLAQSNSGNGTGTGTSTGTDCWDAIKTATAQNVFYCGTCTSIENSKPSAWSSLKKCNK